jgi:hypothetical protein
MARKTDRPVILALSNVVTSGARRVTDGMMLAARSGAGRRVLPSPNGPVRLAVAPAARPRRGGGVVDARVPFLREPE